MELKEISITLSELRKVPQVGDNIIENVIQYLKKDYHDRLIEEFCGVDITTSDVDDIESGSKGLYLLYNDEDKLIYLGKSLDVRRRIRTHIRGSHFFKEISTIKVVLKDRLEHFFEVHPECEDIEYYLIEQLNPLYNKLR